MDWITPFDWTLPDRRLTGVRTKEEYRQMLEDLVRSKTVEDGMIITWGYHHFFHGSISRAELDQICPDKPLIVWHRSFHELYMNSVAMTQAEYEVRSEDHTARTNKVCIRTRKPSRTIIRLTGRRVISTREGWRTC